AYASTLERAWRTAEIGVGHRATPVVRDHAWREVAYGGWEGLTWEEIAARDADLAARRMADPANVAPPGGESFLQLERRLVPAVESLRRRHDGQTVLLVTHGGALRVLAAWSMGLGPNEAWRFRADNCAVSVLRWREEGAVLELWNETAHLRGLD